MYCPWLVKAAARVYTFTFEEVSLESVVMLDLRVTKVRCYDGTFRLSWKPHIKDTARHIPLHGSSWHAASVHRAWPQAEIKRMFTQSLERSDFLAFKQIKLQRFKHHFLWPSVLQECENIDPFFGACPGLNRSTEEVANQPREVRLVLPYHPGLVCLAAQVRRLHDRWRHALHRMGLNISLSITWSSGGRPLFAILQDGKW